MTLTHSEARMHLPEAGLFIGGERVTAGSAGTMERIDPATGEVLGQFPSAGAAEVNAAVRAAH
jgi:acyl-CoA reductase-like NAD-dependent aldehyde dehydrogenase